MANEEEIQALAAAHKERFGRMDVLINNAGVGIGAAIEDAETKKLDLQFDVNLRGVYLMLRESIPMLKEAGAEHGKALVINTASIAGKYGQPWLSAYSATKHAVVGLSAAAHGELSESGVQVTAFCPGFVETPMTEWVREQVPADKMIRPDDIAEAVRFLLRTSPACFVPEVHVHPRRRRAGRGGLDELALALFAAAPPELGHEALPGGPRGALRVGAAGGLHARHLVAERAVAPGQLGQARLQHGAQRAQLPLAGFPGLLARLRVPVPRLGEGGEARPPASAMSRQHRAHAPARRRVRADDDAVLLVDSLEHGDARALGQAVDRVAKLLRRPA